MNETGIVIEGGAMRSIFAAGVLDFFMEKNIEVPNVLAVSAGAYAGMNYVSGQKGRVVEAVIRPLAEEKYMGAATFFRKGTFFDMDYLFDVVPKKKSPFDFEAFCNSAKRFLLSTTSCVTGNCIYYENFASEDEFWRICKAANSMPFISKVTKIDGEPMLDGGMADAIPVAKALEEGWDKLVVILSRNAGYRKKYRHLYLFLIRLVYRRYPKFIQIIEQRADRYNASLDQISRLEKEGKALVIRPTKMTVNNQESDVETLMKYYRHGYEEAMAREEEIHNFLRGEMA